MNVLKGPADADHYRVKVGRYGDRWYTEPLPTCSIAEASDWQGPSYSIVKGASGKDWSFVALGRAADAIAANLNDFDCDRATIYSRLQHANKHGLSIAAGRGTIVHWWFEDGLAGKPLREVTDWDLAAHKIPKASRDQAMLYRAAVSAFFDAYQPELVVSEVVCIDRELNGVGYGCTGDAGIKIDGDLYAADWKSRGPDSDHGCYPEECAQVGGAFARAQFCIIEGADGPERALLPAFDGGLVVSVKPEGCRIYPVDLDEARRHFESMHSWWCARRDERKAAGRAWPACKIAARADSTHEAGQPGPVGPPPPSGGSRGRQAHHERYNARSEVDREAFDARKPEGADLDAVEKLLDDIEHPPSMLDQAQQRMAADIGRRWRDAVEVDALAAQGVSAVLSTLAAFLNDEQRAWVGALTSAPVSVGRSFRYSYAKTQRNADICIALAKFAGCAHWDPEHDEGLRAAIYVASGSELALQEGASVPDLLAQLDAAQAAELKNTVDAISEDLLTLSVDAEGALRWTSRAA